MGRDATRPLRRTCPYHNRHSAGAGRGFQGYRAANLRYGLLGRGLCERLQLEAAMAPAVRSKQRGWVQVLAHIRWPKGETQLKMRGRVAQALEETGLCPSRRKAGRSKDLGPEAHASVLAGTVARRGNAERKDIHRPGVPSEIRSCADQFYR